MTLEDVYMILVDSNNENRASFTSLVVVIESGCFVVTYALGFIAGLKL